MLPLDLEEPARVQVIDQLNQLLADTMTLRDLYKKCHWQVAGPTFYQLHLLFDKHYSEENELVDSIAKRIQLLGGVSLAMAGDVPDSRHVKVGLTSTEKNELAKAAAAFKRFSHILRRGAGSTGRCTT